MFAKKIVTMVICFILAFCMSPFITLAKSQEKDETSVASLSGFKDVPADYWAHDAIMWMADNNIVSGVGEGMFAPDKAISRDEYSKIMVLALKLKLINPDTPSFRDVKKGSWQYRYTESAKPYLTGFRAADGDYFRPAEKAVREDMTVALVKALGFSGETPDESLLSVFTDTGSISPNLKKYVAIALKHGLIQGYDRDGVKVFAPQESLTRATAATLLYNAFKSNEEKITFDDEKVTYDDPGQITAPSDDSGDYQVPVVTAIADGDKVIVGWDKSSSGKFSGYKVVISRYDSTPEYPENGYFAYITDRGVTSSRIKAGDAYNGGDFGGRLESGVEYYFTVTILYGDKKVTGNVIRIKMP